MVSVRNTQYIGYGYLLTGSESVRAKNINSEYVFFIDNDRCFFGLKNPPISENGFILPSRWNFTDEEIENMKSEFLSIFPNSKAELKDYMLSDREVIEYPN